MSDEHSNEVEPGNHPSNEGESPTFSEQGERAASFLDDVADLFRRGGRVLDKAQKALSSAEKYTGPLTRPFSDAPARRKPQDEPR